MLLRGVVGAYFYDLRWAILACGKASHDFVQALKLVPSQQVVAVGARRIEDARAFVAKHCDGVYAASAFGSYAETAACDAARLRTLHRARRHRQGDGGRR